MEELHLSTFGELLKAFRKKRKRTQQELAYRIGVHRNTIGIWERGDFLPESKTIVLELANHLRLDSQEARRLLEASMTALSPYWQMPYQRNPFFTGREEVLQQLHDALAHEHTAVLSQSYALSGLGGIGKTQTAVEYAYRYTNDYAAVFWINAETTETIISNMIAIAPLLNLSEKQGQDQEKVVTAVIHWLTNHRNWLLIFDNVEEFAVIKRFLPPARYGSLLFTSRQQSLGSISQALNLEQMTPEEGMHFLLHRARRLDPMASPDSLLPKEKALAQEIVAVMDGLPLALDQAGAYIESTQCSLSDYLRLLQSFPQRLLYERDTSADHPLSVAKTFELAFAQLEQVNITAADFLTVCTHLAPETIPEMFFIEGASQLGPQFENLAVDPFAFQTVLKSLLAYSLIQRNAEAKTVTIHRLVQVILRGRLSEDAQRPWATRVLYAMMLLFPSDEMQADYWQRGEQLLPHALQCILSGEKWKIEEVPRITLMSHVAAYLARRVRHAESQLLYEQALSLGEQTLGSEHSLIVQVLQGLAALYRRQGKYEQAETFSLRALHICEQTLDSEDPALGYSLDNLANMYMSQSKNEQAEALFQRVLHIWKRTLGPEHPRVGDILNSLAVIYVDQGKYEQAELFYQQALAIWEQHAGSESPNTGTLLNNLANLYRMQGKYEQAEPLYLRTLHIWEQEFGPEDPDLGYPLTGLATLYRELGKYESAWPLYQRALRIRQQQCGSQHPLVAETLHQMAYFHQVQQQKPEALLLYQQALTIRQQALGSEHPKTSATRIAYTQLLQELGE